MKDPEEDRLLSLSLGQFRRLWLVKEDLETLLWDIQGLNHELEHRGHDHWED